MLDYNPEIPLFSVHIPKTAGTSFEIVLQRWFNKRYFPNLANHPRLQRLLTPLNIDFALQRLMDCGLYFHYGNHFKKEPPRKIPFGLKYGLLKRTHVRECIHGHFEPDSDGGTLFDFYPQAFQFITFLRDPLEMQLSHYFYNKKMIEAGELFWNGKKITELEFNGDIDRWVEERGFYMLHFLPMKFDENNYKEIINKYFVHIGVTEQIQRSIDILARKLSVESVGIPVENATVRNMSPSESSVKKFKEKHKLEYLIYDYALTLNS